MGRRPRRDLRSGPSRTVNVRSAIEGWTSSKDSTRLRSNPCAAVLLLVSLLGCSADSEVGEPPPWEFATFCVDIESGSILGPLADGWVHLTPETDVQSAFSESGHNMEPLSQMASNPSLDVLAKDVGDGEVATVFIDASTGTSLSASDLAQSVDVDEILVDSSELALLRTAGTGGYAQLIASVPTGPETGVVMSLDGPSSSLDAEVQPLILMATNATMTRSRCD